MTALLQTPAVCEGSFYSEKLSLKNPKNNLKGYTSYWLLKRQLVIRDLNIKF